MAYEYDDQNIFAKILRGEIPNTTVLETEHSLAFRDIQAQAPEHILVIPKGAYVCFDHFANSASAEEIVDFTRAVGQVAWHERIGKTYPNQGRTRYFDQWHGPYGRSKPARKRRYHKDKYRLDP